jgi:Tol biopolymer transport system component
VLGARLAVACGLALAFASTAHAQGGRLAFEVDGEVFTMRIDGSERTQLTRTPVGGQSFEPDWSPDGSRIAFSRGGGEGLRVWAMAADGTGAEPLTTPGKEAGDASPHWSPDGSRVAFVRYRFGDDDISSTIAVVDVATGRERTLVPQPGRFSSLGEPVWSPDGSRMAYTVDRFDRNGDSVPDLWILDVASGAKRRLVELAETPAWSPDGSRIAYSSLRHRNAIDCASATCVPERELYVIGSDGSGDTRLTDGPGQEAQPTWSPDGASIVFVSSRNAPLGGRPELYAIRPDGSCLTWLTNGTEGPLSPAWQPGSGGLPESLGCGAVAREPAGLLSPLGPGHWLGPIGPGNLMLSRVRRESGARILHYDDCPRFDPSECARPVVLEIRPACARHPLNNWRTDPRARLEVRRGALVYGRPWVTKIVDVYTGAFAVTIVPRDAGDIDAVIDALRPLPSADPVAALDPPRFPVRVIRLIKEARRLGGVGAIARVQRVSRHQARHRLRVARVLAPLGRLRGVRC